MSNFQLMINYFKLQQYFNASVTELFQLLSINATLVNLFQSI